ncbi:hypothetical protein GCM10008959_23440 [Deinococcus seoulensis]|uniref:AAA+ ATPase domain-containing protein n=1 Tax=Deinococcus seoulensis TaxID=1837379 RepID=A0ABQ2RRP7_9DEIO|nr:AAA family ATPase [Deinococcus seoulensis]GGR60913.1 hypothetical protein GCM10008959_23440 [Deinococcus seoulensis]
MTTLAAAPALSREPVQRITDDVGTLLRFLPGDVAGLLRPIMDTVDEIKLRYGRPLMVLMGDRWEVFDEITVDNDHLLDINAKVMNWRDDGRKGVEGTCHRLYRTRNADGTIEGVTVRIGRFLQGVAWPLKPYLDEDASLLIMGTPGSGKSTLERDIARLIAEQIRAFCVIVDTSAELSGDGRRAHPGIGYADRVQVAIKAQQADVIWEAVRSLNPRVLVVDEIGYADDARVIRQASKLGVKTVATAHGNTFQDLVENEALSPVYDPPIFRWLVIVAARGVYHLYDLPRAMDRHRQGQVPAYRELRV